MTVRYIPIFKEGTEVHQLAMCFSGKEAQPQREMEGRPIPLTRACSLFLCFASICDVEMLAGVVSSHHMYVVLEIGHDERKGNCVSCETWQGRPHRLAARSHRAGPGQGTPQTSAAAEQSKQAAASATRRLQISRVAPADIHPLPRASRQGLAQHGAGPLRTAAPVLSDDQVPGPAVPASPARLLSPRRPSAITSARGGHVRF